MVKLIGSKMEEDFRSELTRSNLGLQETESKLHKALDSNGYSVSNAYVLHWIPEQLQDIYVVLIEGAFLVIVEINKFDDAVQPLLERIEIKEYLRGLSNVNQVRLAVAQDLAGV